MLSNGAVHSARTSVRKLYFNSVPVLRTYLLGISRNELMEFTDDFRTSQRLKKNFKSQISNFSAIH